MQNGVAKEKQHIIPPFDRRLERKVRAPLHILLKFPVHQCSSNYFRELQHGIVFSVRF